MTKEEGHMKHALKLASRGSYSASPNPMVGCVIVKKGEVVGEGWHIKPGKEHAEINAITNVKKKFGFLAKEKLNGSELYVNLEPCSNQGKTPPCSKSIIDSGIKKVFIATEDSTQQGVEQLSDHGIEINLGLLKDEAERLNQGFFTRIEKDRPFITCKLAVSMDGGIALSNGESKWLSSKQSRLYVHKMRAKSDAIMTGIGTIFKDNPRLTVRLEEKGISTTEIQPIRCVIDSNLRITGKEKIVNDEFKTLIFCNSLQVKGNTTLNMEIIKKPGIKGLVSLKDVCKYLGKREINYLLIESGPKLVESLIKEKLIDQLIFFIAPKLLGKEKLNFVKFQSTLSKINLEIKNMEKIGQDIKLLTKLKYS